MWWLWFLAATRVGMRQDISYHATDATVTTLATKQKTVFSGLLWTTTTTAVAVSEGEQITLIYCKFFECKVGGRDGGAISLCKTVTVRISNCIFEKCEARRGGAISIDRLYSVLTLDITTCQFLENKCTEAGSVLHEPFLANKTSQLMFRNSYIVGPKDSSKGLLITSPTTSLVFSGNTFSSCTGTIEFTGNLNSVSISGCSFLDCSFGTAVTFTKVPTGKITYERCFFENLKGVSQAVICPPSGFTGSLTLTNCNFTSVSMNTKAAALHTMSATNIQISGCNFTSCQSSGSNTNNGGAVIVNKGFSSLSISRSNFFENKYDQDAHSLLLLGISEDAATSITNCLFADHNGEQVPIFSIVECSTTNFCLDSCTFQGNSISGVLAIPTGIPITYRSCGFIDHNAGYAVKSSKEIVLELCWFTSCSLTRVIAPDQSITTARLESCTFDGGTMTEGPVSASSLTILGCTFTNVNRESGKLLLLQSTMFLDMQNCVIANCGNDMAVDVTKISMKNVTCQENVKDVISIRSGDDGTTIASCVFATAPSSISLFSSKSINITGSAFTLTGNTNNAGPMITYTGGELQFYNCCFSEAVQSASDSPLYLQLDGPGHVTFDTVCFDRDLQGSIQKGDQVTIDYLGPEQIFGNCTCWESIPDPDPDTSSTDEPTASDDNKGNDPPNNAGLIAGVVIGILVVIAVAIFLFFFIRRRKLKNTSSERSNEEGSEEPCETTQSTTGITDEREPYTFHAAEALMTFGAGFEEVIG